MVASVHVWLTWRFGEWGSFLKEKTCSQFGDICFSLWSRY
jgi:hypothetical protein